MGDLGQVGRLLLVSSAVLGIVGLAFLLLGRILPDGRLPGDFTITRGPVSCFVPLVASLLLSLLLTILLNLFVRR